MLYQSFKVSDEKALSKGSVQNGKVCKQCLDFGIFDKCSGSCKFYSNKYLHMFINMYLFMKILFQ